LPTRPNKDVPEPWLSFLRELDSSVQEDIRLDCMGGFVVSMVYGFSRPTGDLDVLEIAPREAGRPMLELGMQGGRYTRSTRFTLTMLAWPMCRTTMKSGSPRSFPKCSNIFASLPSTLTICLVKTGTQHPA